jgi:ABC-type multidrug transport system permease subunit
MFMITLYNRLIKIYHIPMSSIIGIILFLIAPLIVGFVLSLEWEQFLLLMAVSAIVVSAIKKL